VLTDGQQEFTCRLNTFHTSNSGSVVLTWALLNHGIVLRSTWDVEKYIENGKLIHILLNGIRKRISGLCILSVRLPAGELKRALLILPGTFLSDFSSPNYCKRAARTVLTGMWALLNK
jgi:DNA-binding transcriptional LysR family regulator